MQESNPAGGFIAFTGGLVIAIVVAVLSIVVADSMPTPSLFPTPPPAAVGAATPTPAPPAPPASGGGGGPGTTVAATEKDFAITLDKSTAPAGTITFNVSNQGPSPHNVGVVAGGGATRQGGLTGQVIKVTENFDGGKSATLTVDLQPGTYQIVCTIPGHVQLGMIVAFTVT